MRAFDHKTLLGVLSRHKKIALQFSGGKDSMACLFLLRGFLDRMTVYWVNTGDPIPETLAVMEECKKFIPRFCEVHGDVVNWRNKNGFPSDLVPTNNSPIGVVIGFGEEKISDRFDCCGKNLMMPLYDKMQADGVTCVIRGQKLVDMPKVPMVSGTVLDGVEFYYPIEQWTHEEVLSYLKDVKAPIPDYYNYGDHGADCLHCTAWWSHNPFRFIKERHPKAHAEVTRRKAIIRKAIEAQHPMGDV